MTRQRFGIATVCLSGVGGSGIVAAEVAIGLAQRGHRVHVISDRLPFRGKELAEAGVRLHEAHLPHSPSLVYPPITLALASTLAEVVAQEKLDRIHVHYALPNAVVAQLARSVLGPEAPRSIVTLHGTDVSPLGGDPAYWPVLRRALSDASILTTPSQYLADQVSDIFKLPNTHQPWVIPNFVDVSRYAGGPDLLERSFTVIHASNFRPVKRALDAVLAFARLAKVEPARMIMVGDGPQQPEARALVDKLGLLDQVRFVGVHNQIVTFLRESDVALMPSASESFGLFALEALGAGLPVVASRVGGLTTVVREGETGLLAEVGDINGFGQCLIHLARNASLRRQLGRAGRIDVERRFHPNVAIDRYESAIEAVDKV